MEAESKVRMLQWLVAPGKVCERACSNDTAVLQVVMGFFSFFGSKLIPFTRVSFFAQVLAENMHWLLLREVPQ